MADSSEQKQQILEVYVKKPGKTGAFILETCYDKYTWLTSHNLRSFWASWKLSNKLYCFILKI